MTPIELDLAFYAESPRRQRCVATLLAIDPPPTYGQVAEVLGIHIGTLHAHLRRVRRHNPEFYAIVMAERRRQLAAYHEVVVERTRERSLRWGRRQAALRYRKAHGEWPWIAYARGVQHEVMRAR